MPCEYTSLEWEPNGSGEVAVLSTKAERYILDPARQQVKTLPADTNPEQAVSQEGNMEPCGDCTYFLEGESPLGEVASACWSPDRVLLAIGEPGTLKVYDANLDLLQTLVVSGTVTRVAWFPIP